MPHRHGHGVAGARGCSGHRRRLLPAALASARALADRLGVEATWVETDVLDARAAVTGDFDVVYTSIGTICWLDDLDRWAAQVAALLRPGGVFFIRDGHPALYALDEDADELVARHRYFADGTAQQWDDAGTYAGDGTVANTRPTSGRTRCPRS